MRTSHGTPSSALVRSFALFGAFFCVLFWGLAAGCASTADSPRELYAATMDDFESQRGTGGFMPETLARIEERYATVIEWFENDRLADTEDKLYAAALLATSDDPDNVAFAVALAGEAAEAGDERAGPVLAEAIDKSLVIQGLPQKYGTHLAWNFALSRWEMYRVDPLVTDADRAALGLPPLAELRARIADRNAEPVSDVLREAQSHR